MLLDGLLIKFSLKLNISIGIIRNEVYFYIYIIWNDFDEKMMILRSV